MISGGPPSDCMLSGDPLSACHYHVTFCHTTILSSMILNVMLLDWAPTDDGSIIYARFTKGHHRVSISDDFFFVLNIHITLHLLISMAEEPARPRNSRN